MDREYYSWRFVALAAGPPAIYALVFWLAFGERSVRSWDFTATPPAQWQWQFPPDTVQTADGAAFVLRDTGLGPRLAGVRLNAEDIRSIQVRARAVDLTTGKEFDASFLLYWAGPQAIPNASNASPPWPFNVERSGLLETVYTKRIADLRVLRPGTSPARRWAGPLEDLLLAVQLPFRSEKGYRVIVSKIELCR